MLFQTVDYFEKRSLPIVVTPLPEIGYDKKVCGKIPSQIRQLFSI
jgi:hypothetical protein